jgi:hypothetical protein
MQLTQPRPQVTTAAKIGTIQLHCHVDHAKWLQNDNSMTSPVDCAICYGHEDPTRYTCTFCSLRVCTNCKNQVNALVRSGPLQAKIDASIEARMRMDEQNAAQRGLLGRPPSSGSIYESADMDPLNRGYGGTSMRSARSMGNIRGNGPFYGGPGGVPQGAGPAMRPPQPGNRRFSQGNVAAPADYPPPPQRMLVPNTPTSPRGRSPTPQLPQGGGRGYAGDYQPRNGPRTGGNGYNNTSSGGGFNGPDMADSAAPRARFGGAVTARRERLGQDTMRGAFGGQDMMRGPYPT